MLRGDSPAVNAGDPAAQYQDGDGTRNDLGVTGGPFAASPLHLSAYTSMPVPVAGDELSFVLELTKASVNPDSAAIQIDLPPHIQLSGKGVETSGVPYQILDGQISLTTTDLYINSVISLSVQLQIDPQLDNTPIMMNFPITVESASGTTNYESVIFPNGSSTFLPVMTR